MHLWLIEQPRWLAVALVALGFAAVPAGAADVRWKDRGDRFEGLRAENIAGGDFELLGVHVEPETRARGTERLWVSVPLREPAKLRVRVWEPGSGYQMIPKRQTYRHGESFSWARAAVLEPIGVEAEQLYVLATDPRGILHYPAHLTTEAPSARVSRYVFRFHSRGGVGLDETIYREDEKRKLLPVTERRRDEEFGGILDFTWDGRAPSGEIAPAGVYHLKLNGTVYATVDRKLKIDLPFVHYGEMAP